MLSVKDFFPKPFCDRGNYGFSSMRQVNVNNIRLQKKQYPGKKIANAIITMIDFSFYNIENGKFQTGLPERGP
jgi:hypothetical protein